MTDFKVGDRVRRRDGSDTNHYTVNAASVLFEEDVAQIVQIGSAGYWHFAADFERVSEPKPQYRLRRNTWYDGTGSVWANSGPQQVVSAAFGPIGINETAAQRAVRAALDALHPEGWEEIK